MKAIKTLRDNTAKLPENAKTKRLRQIKIIVLMLFSLIILFAALRFRPALKLEYDMAYWPENIVKSDDWYWCQTAAGIRYNLFIPNEDTLMNSNTSIPLIVVFHGSTQGAIAKDRFGRIFTGDEAQSVFGADGAAVLVLQSRVEYFSDPHSYSRLIQNVIQEHRCIDKRRIAGYGFSQGAAFVQELAMYDCSLFKAVASGSSYYSASPLEFFKAARVQFYCATSKDDKGIFEQGHVTAMLLSMLCPNSRYVEYENRGHFFIEMKDKSGRGDETFATWIAAAMR